MSNDLILSPLNNDLYHFVPNGLYIADSLDYTDWQAIGGVLQFLAKTIQFALGDWINYGERAYGEKYAQAIEQTEYAYGTLRNYAYVAGKIELSRRCDELSFAHHSEVAKLDAAQQDAWLETAALEGYSTRQLRNAITNTTEAARKHCPYCGQEWEGLEQEERAADLDGVNK